MRQGSIMAFSPHDPQVAPLLRIYSRDPEHLSSQPQFSTVPALNAPFFIPLSTFLHILVTYCCFKNHQNLVAENHNHFLFTILQFGLSSTR